MKAIIPIEVPAEFRQVLADQAGDASVPRWALEALVIEAVREGLVSRGFGGEMLGINFHEREKFFASRGIVYDFSETELDAEQRDLESFFGNA